MLRAPRAQLRDDQSGMPVGEGVGGEAQTLEGGGAIAEHDDMRLGEQRFHLRRARIEDCAAFAMAGVEMLPLRFRQVRGIDAQHVGSQQGESAGADRAGDHAGEIEDADAVKRCIRS